jgi:hypothetical protein
VFCDPLNCPVPVKTNVSKNAGKFLGTQTARGMNTEQKKADRGGRPPKPISERATQKINCWVTVQEKEQLQAEYGQLKAGGQLVFATYLKLKLLNPAAVTPGKPAELLVRLLIGLQDQRRQLDTIDGQLQRLEKTDLTVEISGDIRVQLASIQETLTLISAWLYES